MKKLTAVRNKIAKEYSVDSKNLAAWNKKFAPHSENLRELTLLVENYTDHCIHNLDAALLQVDKLLQEDILPSASNPDTGLWAKVILSYFMAMDYLSECDLPESVLQDKLYELLGFIQEKLQLSNKFSPEVLYPLAIRFYPIFFNRAEFNEVEDDDLKLPFLLAQFALHWYRLMGDNKFYGICQTFIDKMTGNRIYSFPINKMSYLIGGYSNLYSGLANIKSADFLGRDALLVSFLKGTFFDLTVEELVAFNCALVLTDFKVLFVVYKRLTGRKLTIYLEMHWSNLHFSRYVLDRIHALEPELFSQFKLIPALTHSSTLERLRYLAAENFTRPIEEYQKILAEIDKVLKSLKISFIKQAFDLVKCFVLHKDEELFAEGSYPGFVYLALDDKLYGISQTSDIKFYIEPYQLVAHISVMSEKKRQASLFAANDTRVLMIPREIFLLHWFDYHLE